MGSEEGGKEGEGGREGKGREGKREGERRALIPSLITHGKGGAML